MLPEQARVEEARMAKYRCRLTDQYGHTDSDAREVEANGLQDAAERYAEWYDREVLEFEPERRVLVWDRGEWVAFDVEMRDLPVYTARRVKGVGH